MELKKTQENYCKNSQTVPNRRHYPKGDLTVSAKEQWACSRMIQLEFFRKFQVFAFGSIFFIQNPETIQDGVRQIKKQSLYWYVVKITIDPRNEDCSDRENMHLGVRCTNHLFVGRSCLRRTSISSMEYEGNKCGSIQCSWNTAS